MKKVGVFKIITDEQHFLVIADTVESAIKVAEKVMDECPFLRAAMLGVGRDGMAWAEGDEK